MRLCSAARTILRLLMLQLLTAAHGPTLPTWALQQVGSYRGYTGCSANVVAKATLTHLRHWLCTAPIVSVPIKVPVSADAILSSELGNRYAAREFITLVGGTAAACPLAAHAQQPARSRKVGLLHPGESTNRP